MSTYNKITIGGTTVLDLSQDTVADASHIRNGYVGHLNDGTQVTGTYSGGGGSGLEYEIGTYTPTSDTAQPTINFANSHTKTPIYAMIMEMSGVYEAAMSVTRWAIINTKGTFDKMIKYASSTNSYGCTQFMYTNSSSSSTQNSSNLTGVVENTMNSTRFLPYAGSTSRYFRAGHTYKWIAIWGPTT